jgi:4-carboxymuconolactone decarboxylase
MRKQLITIILISLCSISIGYAADETKMYKEADSERFVNGLNMVNKINGEGSGESIVDALKDVSPDLARYAIEYGFGDVLSRKTLHVKIKEMIIIANLAAMGNAQPQLKAHINAALNVGVTQEEIAEIMILTSAYAGFPAAMNGTLALKNVLSKRTK